MHTVLESLGRVLVMRCSEIQNIRNQTQATEKMVKAKKPNKLNKPESHDPNMFSDINEREYLLVVIERQNSEKSHRGMTQKCKHKKICL